MKILLTGGTGMIGCYLIQRLQELNHEITVVTRNPEKARQKIGVNITIWKGLENRQHLNNFDAVINLAGESIAKKRWTNLQKRKICDSRWFITKRLVNLFKASDNPPSVLISGSAIGYYGNLGDIEVTEENLPKDSNEFTHKLCARWEQIASEAQSCKTRVCMLRIGIVLAPRDGFLNKIMPIFKIGLGGSMGNGRQYLAWIHIEDVINSIIWLLNKNLYGPFNIVSPYPVCNKQFVRILGKVLHRPTVIHIPATFIRILMGESALLVLRGQRALPKRLLSTGFKFLWCNLEETLINILYYNN